MPSPMSMTARASSRSSTLGTWNTSVAGTRPALVLTPVALSSGAPSPEPVVAVVVAAAVDSTAYVEPRAVVYDDGAREGVYEGMSRRKEWSDCRWYPAAAAPVTETARRGPASVGLVGAPLPPAPPPAPATSSFTLMLPVPPPVPPPPASLGSLGSPRGRRARMM